MGFDGLTEFGQRALARGTNLYQAPGGVEGLFSGEDFDVDDEIAERHRSAQKASESFWLTKSTMTVLLIF